MTQLEAIQYLKELNKVSKVWVDQMMWDKFRDETCLVCGTKKETVERMIEAIDAL